MGLELRFVGCCCVALLISSGSGAQSGWFVSSIYTRTPCFEREAAGKGIERFPDGASLQLMANGAKRELAPGFAASADAAISFDGRRVLFAGKQKTGDPWQIWEAPVSG